MSFSRASASAGLARGIIPGSPQAVRHSTTHTNRHCIAASIGNTGLTCIHKYQELQQNYINKQCDVQVFVHRVTLKSSKTMATMIRPIYQRDFVSVRCYLQGVTITPPTLLIWNHKKTRMLRCTTKAHPSASDREGGPCATQVITKRRI